PPGAAHAGRAGDAAALDRHRLHRARRFPGIAHLKPRGALAAAALSAALAAPFLFTGLGRAPFDDPGEGMHAEIARELAASGDPLRLTLDGVRYVDKPPLLYLLLASAFAVGGASEGTARAVAALGALVAVAATAWLGSRLHDGPWGLLAGVALLTSCGFFAYGRYVRPETLFVAGLIGGFALLLPAVLAGHRGLAALGLAVFGLAALAKDPLGALLPPVAVGLALAAAGRARPRAWRDPAQAPWIVLALWATGVLALTALSPFRLPHYGLPAYPAIALLAARGWSESGRPLALIHAGLFAALSAACAVAWASRGAPLARVLDAADVATHKAAAAGAGASLDPALFVPVLGVGALAFGAGALVLIALIVAGRAARVAAAATAVTLLATLPCVALGLEAVAATRSVKPIALELARRAGPADVVVHEGPLENSGALEWYSGRRPVILDGRRS